MGSGLNVVGRGGGGAGEGVDEVGEVETGVGAAEVEGGDVVGGGGHLGKVVAAEPDAGFFAGLADFGDPFAPFAFTDAGVSGFGHGGK